VQSPCMHRTVSLATDRRNRHSHARASIWPRKRSVRLEAPRLARIARWWVAGSGRNRSAGPVHNRVLLQGARLVKPHPRASATRSHARVACTPRATPPRRQARTSRTAQAACTASHPTASTPEPTTPARPTKQPPRPRREAARSRDPLRETTTRDVRDPRWTSLFSSAPHRRRKSTSTVQRLSGATSSVPAHLSSIASCSTASSSCGSSLSASSDSAWNGIRFPCGSSSRPQPAATSTSNG